MLIDQHNRIHDYLRISLTDNCNLRCFYCMTEEDYAFMPNQRLMQKDEIVHLASLFVQNGVKKIRLTGGEPLVRKDAAAIIKALGKLGVNLSMTTNATRVHLFIDELNQAGIQSLNISLDTLQKEKFQLLTRRDQFNQVKTNIDLLLAHGFKLKIKLVVVKGMNDHEILDFIAWTKDTPIQIRFIEFMPFDGNKWNSDKLVTLQEMLDLIGKEYKIATAMSAPEDTSKRSEERRVGKECRSRW